MQGEEIDLGPYRVVVNHEDQHSIWPQSHALPAGWRAAGREGSKQECLDHIRQVWVDQRPRSLRDSHGDAR